MKVLVGTDLSESADQALLQAHARAGQGDTLGVCHVLPNLQPIAPLFPQDHQQKMLDMATLPDVAETAIRARVAGLTGRAPQDFEVFVEQGIDHTEIVRRAAEWKADLVVVGSQGHTGLARLFLGSVAERVVRYAACPVLVARRGPGTGPILAATDLSDPSLAAIVAGHGEADRRKAPLTVAHVIDLGFPAAYAAGLSFGASSLSVSAQAAGEITEATKVALTAAMESVGAKGEALVLTGDATRAILHEAEEHGAQLVVIGTHGRTGLMQIALGSVAEKIARTAPCSVLVVRLARSE